MLFKKKQIVNKNMGEIMNDTYNELLDVIRPVLYGKENGCNSKHYDFQLVPFLFSLSLFYVSKDIKKKDRDKVIQDISNKMDYSFAWYCLDRNGNMSELFKKQTEFYKGILGGDPIRAEWGVGWPLSCDCDTRMFIALGDRLYNNDCVSDYIGAKKRSVSKEELEEFNNMMNDLRKILLEYHNEFKSLK